MISEERGKKMKKKLLSLLLCVVIIAAAAVIPAAAYEPDEQPIQLPRVVVTTADGNGTTLQKADGYVSAAITITDTDGSQLSGDVQFKVRGNTTAMESVLKKAYTFKFSKKQEVLSMGKGKKWVLIASAFDPTLLRSYTAFSIAQHLGMEYTSEQKFVEVWLDGSFRGLYTMMEPVEEGKDRVNIDIESNDGMKDFLIEYEGTRVEDDVTYFTTNGLRFALKEPEEPTEAQLTYISGIMDDIVGTVINGSREEIEEKIDVESFVKYYLLNEYYKTFDFDSTSVFYYYQNDKLHAGPAWDYDLTTGNTNNNLGGLNSKRYKDAYTTDGVFANKQLFSHLYKHEWFQEEVRRAFCDEYFYLNSISDDDGMLDQLRSTYSEAIARNYSTGVWRVNKWWINIQKQPLATYDENYDYLKNWLADRCVWLRDYYGVYLKGDTDGDFLITVIDATKVQQILVDLVVDEDGKMTLRSKNDTNLSVLDATLIQRKIADLPVSAPIGEAMLY